MQRAHSQVKDAPFFILIHKLAMNQTRGQAKLHIRIDHLCNH